MGLLNWFKTDRDDEGDEGKPKPIYDPNLGSGWVPGQDKLSMAPDWTRNPVENVSTDDIPHWRPRRRD